MRTRAVLGVYVRALLGFHRRRARRYRVLRRRSGSVTVIQRFGGGFNLNHALLFDGVFLAEGPMVLLPPMVYIRPTGSRMEPKTRRGALFLTGALVGVA